MGHITNSVTGFSKEEPDTHKQREKSLVLCWKGGFSFHASRLFPFCICVNAP